jgi:rhodanese-related sulfurtransferase
LDVPACKAGFDQSGLLKLPPVNDLPLENDLPIEIKPAEVSELLKGGIPLRLIDVREPAEHAICHIEGSTLIPMQSIPRHLNELDADGARIVVVCHHGVRSLAVADWLRRQGIENCQSLTGGIDLWSLQIDPAVPRY